MLPESDDVDGETKFLLPILKLGPNEQVFGLYESLLLAHYMNRKLVLPPFYFHGSDNQHALRRRTVPAELRINVFEMSNVVPFSQYKQYCKSSPDVIFQATNVFFEGLGVKTSRIIDFERSTQNKILSKTNSGRSFLSSIVKVPDFEIDKLTINNHQYSLTGRHENVNQNPEIAGKKTKLTLNDVEDFIKRDWKNIFNPENEENSGKCGIFLLPSKTIQNPPQNMLHAVHPKMVFDFSPEIKEATDKFMSTIKYLTVGVHWRYNNNDFNSKCAKRAPKDRPQECKLVKNIDFKKFATNLFMRSNFLDIYVAAPVTSVQSLKILETFTGEEIRQKVKQQQEEYAKLHPKKSADNENLGPGGNSTNLSKKEKEQQQEEAMLNEFAHFAGQGNYKSRIYTATHLKKFLDANYENAEFYKYYEGETVSLIEQCILSRLEYFYPWPVSAWSMRVLLARDRFSLRNRMDLFKLLEESQKGGSKSVLV